MPKLGFGDWFLFGLLLIVSALFILPLKVFILFVTLSVVAKLWYIHNERQYFSRHGIPSPKGNWLLGHMVELFRNMITFDAETFRELGSNHFGIHLVTRREYSFMDLDVIRSIAVKEFGHFQNRNFVFKNKTRASKRNMTRNMLPVMADEDWKRVRNRTTAAFTTAKLKKLIPVFNKSAVKCFSILNNHIAENKEVDLKDLMSKYGMDVIGNAGFSIDIGVYSKKESPWFKNAKKVFGGSKKAIVAGLCPALAETVETLFDIDMFSNDAQNFFVKFLLDLYDQRKAEPEANEKYADIFQLLLNAVDEDAEDVNNAVALDNRSSTNAEDSDIIHKEILAERKKFLTKTELVSQSFLLLLAGYDTTSTVLHFVLYMLALHPEIQTKLRLEIEEVVGEEEEITFDHMQRLVYLNQIIQETFRMFPGPRISRECNEQITLNGIKVEEGDLVNIPVYAIHHNPEFYPDPEKFDPERFSGDEKAIRDPRTYLPFGLGPRNCLGMRFAEFQIRVVLAQLVKNFTFGKGETSPALPIKIVFKETFRPETTLFATVQRC